MPNEILYEVGYHLPQQDLLSFLKTSRFSAHLFLALLHRFAEQPRNEQPAILWAAQHGYAPLLRILIHKGVDVNLQLKPTRGLKRLPKNSAWLGDCETALHLAAYRGHEEAVRVLLENGASPGIQSTRFRETALHKALLAGSRKQSVIDLLARDGASIDAQRIDGTAALKLAAIRGDKHLVRLLLDSGATVDIKDLGSSTPLHWAVGSRHTTVVKLLLQKGADINARDNHGATPLMKSAAPNPGRGGWAILRLLLDNGAATNLKNKAGHTALKLAAVGKGRTQTVKANLLQEFEKQRLSSLRDAAGRTNAV